MSPKADPTAGSGENATGLPQVELPVPVQLEVWQPVPCGPLLCSRLTGRPPGGLTV